MERARGAKSTNRTTGPAVAESRRRINLGKEKRNGQNSFISYLGHLFFLMPPPSCSVSARCRPLAVIRPYRNTDNWKLVLDCVIIFPSSRGGSSLL